MYSYIDQIKHHQVRVKKASVASKSKAEKDLNFVLAQFQDKLKSIEASYESPYMEKTRVHYPEMFQLLQQLRSKIQNDKRIKALVPTER
jgi:O-glycosyl hydrolase